MNRKQINFYTFGIQKDSLPFWACYVEDKIKKDRWGKAVFLKL